MPADRYRSVLSDRRLGRVFVLVLAGRLGYALFPLCLLFTVARSTGSFATGAASLAAYGAAGLVMPFQARLLDRHDQRRVLPLTGTVFVVHLLVIAALGAHATGPDAVWIALSLTTGLCAPSLGPSMRAQWREAIDEDRRPAAYSLDATAEEMVFFLGPVAASALLATGTPWCGVALAALLVPIGIAGLTRSPFTPPPRPPSAPRPGDHPWRSGPFRRLLLVATLAGAATGSTLTVVAALADEAGKPSAAGLVEAACGVMSVTGGLWWGSRATASRNDQHAPALLMAARLPPALGCLAFPHLGAVATLVAIGSLAVSPLHVAAFTASDRITGPHRRTEASTWVTCAGNLGVSAGTALAGILATRPALAVVVAVLAAGATAGPGGPAVRITPGPRNSACARRSRRADASRPSRRGRAPR